jgi:hypothetical protein
VVRTPFRVSQRTLPYDSGLTTTMSVGLRQT